MNAIRTMPRKRTDTGEESEPNVSITIRFPASLRKRAVAVAIAEDRAFSSLVIYALRRYVTEHERGAAQADNGK